MFIEEVGPEKRHANVSDCFPEIFADDVPRLRDHTDFSQGGVMAYALALRNPARYAALVALSSWLPEELAGRMAPCPEDVSLPVFISHGSEDPMIPIARAEESNERMRGLGYAPLYREYKMQHEIRPECLRDLVGFLDDKVFAPIQPT